MKTIQWTVKYVGIPCVRVVSSRGSILPRRNSAMRQAVVKIKSEQTLSHIKSSLDGEKESSRKDPIVKRLQEYLVLQRRVFEGVEGPWKVWGTVDETSVNEILERTFHRQRAGVTTAS